MSTRRNFLKEAASTLGIVATANWKRLVAGNSLAESIGKDPRLLTLSESPLILETPKALLAESVWTPSRLLFVRNNAEIANSRTLAPILDERWEIAVDGMVEFPKKITLGELRKLPMVETTTVLQCSGNGRSLFSRTAMTEGTQWGQGGVGNVKFGGVSLKTLVDSLKVNVADEARFVTAEGRDHPTNVKSADFEHSLPREDVYSRSLLALTMNGEPIPAIHGGPVRLITPGYFATMHIKWLSRLRFEAHETANHHHLSRYRVPKVPIRPGDKFTPTFGNSVPNWRMKIHSMILGPASGASASGGKIAVMGVAWNDGSVPLTSVEVSVDQGARWKRAEFLEDFQGPVCAQPLVATSGWRPWKTEVELPSGRQEIWSRATDDLGRSQPLDGSIYWNPHGYEWNGVDKVTISVT